MNRLLKTAFILVLVTSCTNPPNTNHRAKNPDQPVDSVKQKAVAHWKTIVNEDNLKIEANYEFNESMDQRVKVKFQPYIWFEDFPARTLDTITKAPLDFSTNKEAKWYITAIKTGYKEGHSTFGGHYELIMWGCGSPCAHGVIVDRKTGQMVHLPESQIGYEFRYNSLMLIVNPTDEEGFYDTLDLYINTPMIYVFDEEKKEFRLLEPKGR
nr:hypothetical protein [uncultured Fluviicola sp.]